MSNNLTPERRVNKLGHLVTKYVRGNTGGGSASGLLASVAPSLDRKLSERAERRSLHRHVSEAVEYWHRWHGDKNIYSTDAQRRQSYCDEVSKFSIESFRYVAGLCDTSGSWDELDRVMMVITHRSSLEDGAVTGLRYRSALGDTTDEFVFLKRLNEVDIHFSDDRFLAPAEEGTEEFAFNVSVVDFALRVHDYVMGSAGRISLDSGHPEYFTPVSRELVQVLREYPDRADDILGFMSDRGLVPFTVSDGALRDYLEAPSVPLRNGAL